MIWSCFCLAEVWAAEIEESCPSTLCPQPNALTTISTKYLPTLPSVKNCNGGKRCLLCNLLIIAMKRKCFHYRTGFNCVLQPQRLHYRIYSLCSFHSLWEERPYCQWSSVELGGYSLPVSRVIRSTAQTDAAFPDIPWLACDIPESS